MTLDHTMVISAKRRAGGPPKQPPARSFAAPDQPAAPDTELSPKPVMSLYVYAPINPP